MLLGAGPIPLACACGARVKRGGGEGARLLVIKAFCLEMKNMQMRCK